VHSFLETLVRRFPAWGFVFHVDAGGETLALHGAETARLVIAHPDGPSKVPRPIGYQFTHVVLLRRPSGFLSFVEGKGSVRPMDRVLFVVSEEALEEEETLGREAFWRRGPGGGPNRMHRFGSTVFVATTPKGLALYDVCHFCGPSSGRLRPAGLWASPATALDVFPDNWKDLRGQEVRVLYVPFPPIIWCEASEVVPGGCRRERVCRGGASGPEGGLLDVVRGDAYASGSSGSATACAA
jgi:hypothetical protein